MIDTPTYAALSEIPEIIATNHIGGPSMADACAPRRAACGLLPVDSQLPDFAQAFPYEARACWSGTSRDGPEPLVALAGRFRRGTALRSESASAWAWAQAPMFLRGKLENFVDYNIPIAHARLEGLGPRPAGPPARPTHTRREPYMEGAGKTGAALGEPEGGVLSLTPPATPPVFSAPSSATALLRPSAPPA